MAQPASLDTAPDIRWCTPDDLTALRGDVVACRNLFGQPGLLRDLIARMTQHPQDRNWYRPARVGLGPVWVAAGGFKGPPRDGTVEIGYRVHPDYRRRGFASALTRWLCREAEKAGLNRVVAVTAPTNVASQGVLSHNGFVHTGDFLSDSQQWLQRWQYSAPHPWPTSDAVDPNRL